MQSGHEPQIRQKFPTTKLVSYTLDPTPSTAGEGGGQGGGIPVQTERAPHPVLKLIA